MTKYIHRLFIFVLVFSPLAFGTVEPWSIAVMETASFVALVMYLRHTAKRATPFYNVPGIVPLLLLLLFLCVQLVPLPAGVIRLVSPQTCSIYATSSFTPGQSGWRPLSINAKATVAEFFRLASYAAFYILTVQLLTRRKLLQRTVAAIVLFGGILSLFAILQHVISNGRIYWLREPAHGGALFGPYVNRNHFAGLMEMILPLVLGLFLFHKPGYYGGSLRERISAMFADEATNFSLLLGLSAVLAGISIFLSLSRGGVVSLSLSMIMMSALLIKREKKKKRMRLFILILSLTVLCFGWFGWKPLLERFEPAGGARISELRAGIWKDSSRIIADFPFAGTGFGSFSHIYPKYRSILQPGFLDHAHNDYMELLAEGGIIAFVLFGWFLFEVLFTSFRAFARRREPYSIYVFIGAVTGLVSILCHSVVDFNLHIGANGLYFFFLLGLAVSAAHTRMRQGLGETSLGSGARPSPGFMRAGSILIMALSIVFNIGVLIGGMTSASARDLAVQTDPATPSELARIRDLSRRALIFDPLDAGYYRFAADAEWRLEDTGAAMDDYKNAIRLDPANGEYVQMLGLLTSNAGQAARADALLRAGIALDGANPQEYRRYASWLFSAARNEEGKAMVRKAMTLDAANTGEYFTLMVLYGLNDMQMREALPELALPHQRFAEYLAVTGNDGMADEEYRISLAYAEREKKADPDFFRRICSYYERKGMSDEAVTVMNKAIALLPEDAGIRVNAGEAYEKAGIIYRAVQEYRKALVLDPTNETARRKVDGLRQ